MALQDITQNIIVTTPKREHRNLQPIASALSTMDNKHYKALEQYNAIQKVISDLDLNEAEDEWKTNYAQQIGDEINRSVDANTGYYGNSLSDAIKVSAKVYNDPALRGRIKAQQEYKTWKDSVQKGVIAGLWSQDVADMMIEQNPYSYYDKRQGETDEQAIINRRNEANGMLPTGEQLPIVGGVYGKYNNPVKSYDINNALELAAKRVAVEGGGSNVLYFKRADGTLTTNESEADPDNPYPWYIDKYTNVKQIDAAALKRAAIEIINSTPGAKAALEQQLNVGLWKTGKNFSYNGGVYIDNNNNVVDNEFTDENGKPLSVDRYIESLIDPSARLMARNVGTYERTKGLGMDYDAQIAAAWKKPSKYTNGNLTGSEAQEALSRPGTVSNSVNRKINSIMTYAKNKGISFSKLQAYAAEQNMNVNDPDLATKLYSNVNVPDDIRREAYNYMYYSALLDGNRTTNSIETDAVDYISGIANGNATPQGKYGDKSKQIVGQMYVHNGVQQDAIYINLKYHTRSAFSDVENDYTDDILNILTENGTKSLESLGISIEDGKLKIPAASANIVPKVINAVESVGFRGTTFAAGAGRLVRKTLADKAYSISRYLHLLQAPSSAYLGEDNWLTQFLNFTSNSAKGMGDFVDNTISGLGQGVNKFIGNTLNTEILYKNPDGTYTSGNGNSGYENYGLTIGATDLLYNNKYVTQLNQLLSSAESTVKGFAGKELNGVSIADDNNNYRQIVNEATRFIPYASIDVNMAESLGLKADEIKRLQDSSIDAVRAHDPSNDRYFYYGKGVGSLDDVDDITERNKIMAIYRTIAANDPKRISVGLNSVTGDTMIRIAAGLKSDVKSSTEAIDWSRYNDEFVISGDFLSDNPLFERVYNNPQMKGARMIKDSKLANINYIPVVPQKLAIQNVNGTYVLEGYGAIPEQLAQVILGNVDIFANISLTPNYDASSDNELRASLYTDLGLNPDNPEAEKIVNIILKAL